jgi:hypothetical protein
MALFNSSSPAYKTATSPNAVLYAPVAPSSGLAGLFGSLLGGSTPVYKTLDSQARQAPAQSLSSGLMRIFVGSAPSYKTAQAAEADPVDEGSDVDADGEDADDACSTPTDTVVLL